MSITRIGATAVGLVTASAAGLGLLQRQVRRGVFAAAANRDEFRVPRGHRRLRSGGPHGADILFRPAPPGRPTVVFFHGNAQSVASAWPLLSNLPESDFGIAAVEYIGYGLAPTAQRITERRILTGCRAALDVIAEQPEVDSLILLGYSMGSFFASAMAAEGWGERLVLAAPLTSAADIARREAPRVPPRLLLGSLALATMSRAPAVSLPTLILHSDADELFPLSMGRALAGAMPQARLVRLSGATHAGIGDWLAPAVRATSAPFETWPMSEAELARHR